MAGPQLHGAPTAASWYALPGTWSQELKVRNKTKVLQFRTECRHYGQQVNSLVLNLFFKDKLYMYVFMYVSCLVNIICRSLVK